jgi:hypothetical protein
MAEKFVVGQRRTSHQTVPGLIRDDTFVPFTSRKREHIVPVTMRKKWHFSSDIRNPRQSGTGSGNQLSPRRRYESLAHTPLSDKQLKEQEET